MKRGALGCMEVCRPFTGSAPGVHEACMRGARRRPRGSARRHGRCGREEDEDAKRRTAKQDGSETPAGEVQEGNQVRSADRLKGLIGTPFQFQSAPQQRNAEC